jgi:serine/threonine protein phosphatase PrpC
MGGHKGGERASAIAVRLIATDIINSLYMPLLAGSDRTDQPPMSEILDKALQNANTAIHEAISEGGGTTCTTAVVLRDMVYIAHVGDSRCYLITKDTIEQLTRDHSVVQRLVELGQLTPEDALAHPRGHELYRVLGFKESVDVDIFSRRLSAGSRLLLCCDGLWNLVHESDLRHIVLDATSPQDACNALIARANMAGGRDNITAIVVQPK